ncbi:2-5-dichloro-2-5-cyclohexadiene-1-4-diol dehydrogenase [Apiospora arundinis]
MENTTESTVINNAAATPWDLCLDELVQDGVEASMTEIFRRLLASQSDSAAAEAAQQLDNHYREDYSSNPLLKLEEDRGLAGYLSCLYEMVFDLARAIPHDNDLQNRLVQFLVELARLPPKEVTIWKEKCLLYAENPVYTVILDDNWNGSYPSSASNPETPETLKRYDEWVNFSTFVARIIRAGLNDKFDNWDKYPSFDTSNGLESSSDRGPRRDCLILVATQYLQILGEKMYRRYIVGRAVGSKERQWGLDQWRLWSDKLQEIGNGQTSSNPEVVKAARDTLVHIVSLESSIQAESRDANKGATESQGLKPEAQASTRHIDS